MGEIMPEFMVQLCRRGDRDLRPGRSRIRSWQRDSRIIAQPGDASRAI
jgi:hypothetical protein